MKEYMKNGLKEWEEERSNEIAIERERYRERQRQREKGRLIEEERGSGCEKEM